VEKRHRGGAALILLNLFGGLENQALAPGFKDFST
jgi:hypothetical protein